MLCCVVLCCVVLRCVVSCRVVSRRLLHIAYCILHIAYCILHIAYCILHIAYCILHCSHLRCKYYLFQFGCNDCLNGEKMIWDPVRPLGCKCGKNGYGYVGQICEKCKYFFELTARTAVPGVSQGRGY